jgi:Flp pilus assembly protein TadD
MGASRARQCRTAALALLTMVAGCTSMDQQGARPVFTREGQRLHDIAPRAVLIANGEHLDQLPRTSYQDAKEHLLAGRYGLAISAFRRELATHPKSVAALNGLAIAYGRVGRDDLSLRWFEQALLLDPGSTSTLNNIGFWALERGQLDLAHRYLERAAEQAPGDPRIAANLALLASVTPSPAGAHSIGTQPLFPPNPLSTAPPRGAR